MFLPLLLNITIPTSAWQMIYVSLGLAVGFTSILYMIGNVLQNQQMLALAKEEVAAFVFTLFLLVFWIGFDQTLNAITSGILSASIPPGVSLSVSPDAYTSGYISTHITLANSSLELLYEKLKSDYTQLYLFEVLIGFLSTVSFPLGSPTPGINIISFSVAPFTCLSLLSQAHTVIVESISYMITVIWAKQFMLNFAKDVVPILLLPLGLVMRAFPFTRTTGSSILALCFALYFVMPFAFLLSNYLVFDVYLPGKPDFTYVPTMSTFFSTQRSAADWESQIEQARTTEGNTLNSEFQNNNALANSVSSTPACTGGALEYLLCSAQHILSGVWSTAVNLSHTVFGIWRFMMGFTGDFFYTLGTNPLMPASTSAGLYYFIIQEVGTISPFIILLTVTTVLEIVFTVTLYRNISVMIGGDADIVGLAKIV